MRAHMKAERTGSTGRTSAPRGEASREAILSAAVRVVGKEGLPAASLGAIAKEAGTSKPAVLYHFGSRENLLREMSARALQQFTSSAFSVIRSDDPYERTRIGLDNLFAPENKTNVAAARELMSLGLRDPVVGEMVRKSFEEVERAAALLLPDSIEEPERVAEEMVRSVHGFLQVWLCTGGDDPTAFKQGAMNVCLKLNGLPLSPPSSSDPA